MRSRRRDVSQDNGDNGGATCRYCQPTRGRHYDLFLMMPVLALNIDTTFYINGVLIIYHPAVGMTYGLTSSAFFST